MDQILKPFALLLVGLILFSCEEQKQSVLTPDDESTLRYLKEVEWPKAYAEQDTVLLDRILGDDFQMIDQSGNWYKKAYELAWIKKNATRNDSFRYEIKRLDILDNGTAMICGTGHIYNDTIYSIYQSSNVLVKRNGTWKAVLSHVSGVKTIED